MNKLTKAFTVSSVIAFIGTLMLSIITAEGVTFSPGISAAELESLSYTEASELMAQRAKKITAYEFISSSIKSSWFWIGFLKMWVVLLAVSFVSFILTEKWQEE